MRMGTRFGSVDSASGEPALRPRGMEEEMVRGRDADGIVVRRDRQESDLVQGESRFGDDGGRLVGAAAVGEQSAVVVMAVGRAVLMIPRFGAPVNVRRSFAKLGHQ